MINCEFENGNKALLRHVCADVIVIKDDKVLLVKRSMKLSEGGKWGLTGGYMERDETVAQAAAREVHEESGWEIADLQLLTINDSPLSKKEDRQNITFVYIAQATEKTGEADWESDEVRWFSFDELPPLNDLAFDHGKNIALYQRYLTEKFSLPCIM